MTVTLRQLVQELAETRNIDFRGYKLSSLERRFRHRMGQLRIDTFDEYLHLIREKPDEVNDLLNAVFINVTEFFRDPPAWEILREGVLPQTFSGMRPRDGFRAWSAGCASGEEAYSLAILISELLGENRKLYEIKIYATDVDEDALNVARRGEYPADKLRHLPAPLLQKYFHGERLMRINRDVRRMCIFGHSNLARDAPISHVDLLLCRNVLIYFDSELQARILDRFRYALNPGGALMLGKSESQLSQNDAFVPLSPKWRIFRKTKLGEQGGLAAAGKTVEEEIVAKARQEYGLLKLYHDAVLDAVEPGILVVDAKDVVVTENDAVRKLLGIQESLVGKALLESELPAHLPGLRAELEKIRSGNGEPQRIECAVEAGDPERRNVAVTLRPVLSKEHGRVGILIHIEDLSPRQKLQSTIEELETTTEELQSTNEELETTNEELQSTNEELETTNEELQSANEELETTNEELQAVNEELGTTNEELEVRGRELDEVNTRYAETLDQLPWPAVLIEPTRGVQMWNAAATELFGLPAKSVIGLELNQLPFAESFRRLLIQGVREASIRRTPRVLNDRPIELNHFRGRAKVRFTPLSARGAEGVLVIVEASGDGEGTGARKGLAGSKKRALAPKGDRKKNAAPKKPTRKR